MRKKISIFLCVMMVFVMSTGVAMAKTYNEKRQQDAKSYNVQQIGGSSELWARATNNTAYVTLENTSSSSKYLTCQMNEYTANVGWTDIASAEGMELPGCQISAQISRQTSLAGYYYYAGYCYNDQSCRVVLDDYLYKGYQWFYQ